jgi:DNA-binding MarR family transcriptional regulator
MYGQQERGRGPRQMRPGRGPNFAADDQFHLGARLWYLMKLMRHGDAGMRPGERRSGGFRGQGRVLRLLSLQSPIAQKELTYLLGIRSQSLAEQLGKLEEAGLVERHPNPEDRRTSVVALTDKGREMIDSEGDHEEVDPFAALDESEKQQLADLLDRVIEGMETNLPDGPDPRMQMFKKRAFGAGADDEPGAFGGFGGRAGGRPDGRPGGRSGRRHHGRRGRGDHEFERDWRRE